MPMNTDKKQKRVGKQVGKSKYHSHVRAHEIDYQHISDAEENPNEHIPHQEQNPPSRSNTEEEEEVARCLLMLSNANVGPVFRIGDGERTSTYSSKEDGIKEEILPSAPIATVPRRPNLSPNLPSRTFPCGRCKKVFTSHQALGGHRASHKKVKGCFTAKIEIKSADATKEYIEDENSNTNHQNDKIESFRSGNMPLSIASTAENLSRRLPKKSTKVHVCFECNCKFSSGQALGGHKRSHSAAVAAAAAVTSTVKPMFPTAANMEVGASSSMMNVMQPHTLNLLQMFSASTSIMDLNMAVPTDNITKSPPKWGWEMNQTRKDRWAATTSDNENEKEKALMENLEDEVESKEVNLANLSDLMVDNDEEYASSEWLQIGFGSMFHKEGVEDYS